MPNANTEKPVSEEPALTLERTFDCTAERLWEASTDPAQYARWLNPAPGLDLVIHTWELRPGGRVRFDMPRPEGWNAGFEKLKALITGQAPSIETRSIAIERLFDCSPHALWDAWTKPELLARWFGPFPKAEVESMEIREGGRFRLAIVDGKGRRYPVWGEYQELDPPRLIVFQAQVLEIGDQVSTVRIEIEPAGERTRMRLTQSGLPVQVADGTGEGWDASWDKLDTLLEAEMT